MKYSLTIYLFLSLGIFSLIIYENKYNTIFFNQFPLKIETKREDIKQKIILTKWENIETKFGFFDGHTVWENDNEAIYGITILITPGKYSSTTNYYGNFRVRLPYGKYKLNFYLLNHLLKTDYIVINSEISRCASGLRPRLACGT